MRCYNCVAYHIYYILLYNMLYSTFCISRRAEVIPARHVLITMQYAITRMSYYDIATQSYSVANIDCHGTHGL